MRIVPEKMTKAWKAEAKIGENRPVVRATIQVQRLKKFPYDTAWAYGGTFETDRHRVGNFTSFIFGEAHPLREVRNIQNYTWTRSVDQDVATCTLTFLNSEISPIGNMDEDSLDPLEFDRPGYFTYNRGETRISENRWGYDTDTGWNGIYAPDRVVKTYEGYGADPTVMPAEDSNLVQSGTWLIDKVTYGHDGTVTLEMRDLGRLLLDQIVFPPIIPYEEYPLTWSAIRTENVPGREATGGSWERDLRKLGRATSSNAKYIGHGLTNPPFKQYVTANGGWNGHHPNHALVGDDDGASWMSTGQESRNSTVWWQYDLDDPTAVGAIKVQPRGGAYRMYVSIHDGDGWIGKRKVPYKVTTEGIDIDAKIPFVSSHILDRRFAAEIVLKKIYPHVKKIRLTFTRLQHFGVGEYPWRAGLKDVQIYHGNAGDMGFEHGEHLKVVGNYADYTQIVKWVCAWGGFYWPPGRTKMDFIRIGHGDEGLHRFPFPYPHAILPDGRVWGDFMRTGTVGEADLTIEQFDKKPLMDVINYVRDLTGFSFWIDETGGIVWRMPNLWSLGNYIEPHQLENRLTPPLLRRRKGKDDIVVLDEETTLLSYTTALDGTSIRDRIFVANIVGGLGTVIKGFNPFPVGLRRIAGWTDQRFETKRETRVMADMLSAAQMFGYRRGRATTPGYPAIQIDDQIRIIERVTNETYYHYVLGITSSLDMETGEWTYDLETHWLGERPSDAWVVKVDELPTVTQNYLAAVGYEDAED